MINTDQNIISVILAGGQGRRFGGLDKGLQLYQNKPLIEHVLSALSKQTSQLILSANRNFKSYQQYGFEVFSDNADIAQTQDDHRGYQGPLAGLVAAIPLIERKKADFVLLASCDTPALPNNYANKLYAALANKPEHKVAVVHDGQRSQNLHCLIRVTALESLQSFYHSGGRAIYQWQQQNNVIEVDFSDQAQCFFNINKPSQLG